jgi:hypothetical protein
MSSLLFCDVMQYKLVVTGVLGQPIGLILKIGPIGCPETSVTTNLHCVHPRTAKISTKIDVVMMNLPVRVKGKVHPRTGHEGPEGE